MYTYKDIHYNVVISRQRWASFRAPTSPPPVASTRGVTRVDRRSPSQSTTTATTRLVSGACPWHNVGVINNPTDCLVDRRVLCRPTFTFLGM